MSGTVTSHANSLPLIIIADADGSCVSIVIIHICNSVCDSVCMFDRLHDKTKMAETKIAKLCTAVVRRELSLTS